jgi:hypothetical protein
MNRYLIGVQRIGWFARTDGSHSIFGSANNRRLNDVTCCDFFALNSDQTDSNQEQNFAPRAYNRLYGTQISKRLFTTGPS